MNRIPIMSQFLRPQGWRFTLRNTAGNMNLDCHTGSLSLMLIMYQLQPRPNRLTQVWDDHTKGYLLGKYSPKRNSEDCTPGNHTLAPLIASMDFPRVKVTKFDGISHFEFCVESKTACDGQRLLCLLHYCRGRARKTIEECTVHPPPEAYRRARQILSRLSGRSHLVARSLLDGLHEGFRAFSASPADLLQLTIKLENCKIALKQMGYEADLNSLSTLQRLARCLPISLQQKWAQYVDGVTTDEREPTFRALRNFMDIRARISNSRLGMIACQTNKCHAAQKIQPKQTIKREPHPLTDCARIVEFESSKRWDVAKGCRVCFRCLKSGHLTKACNTELKCGVTECKARHHYLLHTTPDPSRSVQGTCNTANVRQRSTVLDVLPFRNKVPLGKLAVYALLDNGFDTTLVSHDVLQKLGIPPHPSQLTIKAISGTCLSESCVGNLETGALLDNTWVNIEKAFVVSSIMQSVNVESRIYREDRTQERHIDVFVFLYDLLGILAPPCLPPKQLLQRLYRTGLGWDTSIDQSRAEEWTDWVTFVTSLGRIRQPRCMASRGIRDKASLGRWLDGPDRLHAGNDLPIFLLAVSRVPEGIEYKRASKCVDAICSKAEIGVLFNRYSDWFKLTKAVAWWLRFSKYLEAWLK
ncbi:hypothetical protein X801_06844 [Opisthorchis viverrini]|uniref:CCHC-type domain-containing protein n=1 Tax=Opisthorchis viverrini TaxID=6198 RepID=A0A1S8WS92_OPIVI|nr:hypothetical protein X801_06844 [Opisthorchis viverrini]